jgi:hypothetical protein
LHSVEVGSAANCLKKHSASKTPRTLPTST